MRKVTYVLSNGIQTTSFDAAMASGMKFKTILVDLPENVPTEKSRELAEKRFKVLSGRA